MKLSITIYPVFGLLALLLCACTSTRLNTTQLSNSTSAVAQNGNSSPALATPVPSGFVENEHAAIDIAVIAWIPIYGKEHIESEKPYEAKLKNGIWEVSGSIPGTSEVKDPSQLVGGAAFAKIRQKDGKVVFITHYK